VATIKICILIFFLALFYDQASAQTNQWTVKAGESIQEVLGDSAIYRYPKFLDGKAYYKDGSVSRAPLNFNRITGEMEFIAPSDDTLALANEATINYLTIQRDTFYFDKVYIELIHSNASAKLGKLEIIKLMDVKKEGAYGQMNSTSSITTMDSFHGARQSYKLIEKIDLTLQEETEFFIGDRDNNFSPAVKKNINKMFRQNASTIEPFMKENNIELTKEDDLIKLTDFLGKM